MSRISEPWLLYPEHLILGGIAVVLLVAAVVAWFWFDPTIEVDEQAGRDAGFWRKGQGPKG